jgi:hypothetical protein
MQKFFLSFFNNPFSSAYVYKMVCGGERRWLWMMDWENIKVVVTYFKVLYEENHKKQ